MKSFTDCFGLEVRLTDERLAHIIAHPEMRDMEPALEEVLRTPQIVRPSRSFCGAALLCLLVGNGSH
jgi:hypothetical protein